MSKTFNSGSEKKAMYRILVVDDEQSILKALSMGLSSEDFEVDVAADGAGGILLGTQKEYDILIADLCLPDRNPKRV
jgi:DNA-binding response OmpR family regulator